MPPARLLIATGHADVLDALQGALSHAYLTASIAHAEELPSALEALKPDLVLLDWRLPGGDAAALRAALEREGQGTPVLAVLAEACPEDEAAVYAAGAVDYVVTPVLPPALLARVQVHLMLRRPTSPESVWHDAVALLGGSTAMQAAMPY